MNFNLNETQQMLRDGARRFFADEYNTEQALTIEASDAGFSSEIWRQLSELGWSSVAIPEEMGGSGLGALELCLLSEEIGRAGLSTPLLTSSGLATYVLKSLPDNPLAAELLSQLANSANIIASALIDDSGRNERSLPSLVFTEDGDKLTINGIKQLVPYAANAQLLLVSVISSAGEPAILAIDGDTEGLVISRHQAISGDPIYQVEFNNASFASERLLARGKTASKALDSGLEIATLLCMAEAVGNCESILDLTVEYAKIREQFGQAIGRFQAVSHPIADMRIQIDACRLLMLEAALLLDQGKSASFEIASAKVFANEAIAKIAVDGHRLHGAIGYSNEYNLQLFTRRAKAFCVNWGDTQGEIERAAKVLGL